MTMLHEIGNLDVRLVWASILEVAAGRPMELGALAISVFFLAYLRYRRWKSLQEWWAIFLDNIPMTKCRVQCCRSKKHQWVSEVSDMTGCTKYANGVIRVCGRCGRVEKFSTADYSIDHHSGWILAEEYDRGRKLLQDERTREDLK